MKLFIWTVKHFDQPGAAGGVASKLTGSYSSGTHSLTSAKTGLQNSFPPRLRSACLSSDGLVNLSMSAVLCQGINISQKFDYIAFLGKLKIFSRTLKLIHGQFFILPKIPAGNLYSHIHTNLFYPREWCFLHELLLVIAALRGLLPPLCINTDCYNNLESLRLLRSSVVYQERHSSFSKWLVIQQFYCILTVKKVYLQIVM